MLRDVFTEKRIRAEAAYRDRNLPFLVQRLSKRLSEIHEPFEVARRAPINTARS